MTTSSSDNPFGPFKAQFFLTCHKQVKKARSSISQCWVSPTLVALWRQGGAICDTAAHNNMIASKKSAGVLTVE
jgi:hypothetical protein